MQRCEGNFDYDGDAVDGSDLSVFAADFGRTDVLISAWTETL